MNSHERTVKRWGGEAVDRPPMSRLALVLLGSPRVELNGEPVQIDRCKAIARSTALNLLTYDGGGSQ